MSAPYWLTVPMNITVVFVSLKYMISRKGVLPERPLTLGEAPLSRKCAHSAGLYQAS